MKRSTSAIRLFARSHGGGGMPTCSSQLGKVGSSNHPSGSLPFQVSRILGSEALFWRSTSSASTSADPENANMDTLMKSTGSDSPGTNERATISKAMHAYLKRAKDHQEFMNKEEKEFVLGRRHLANMMGKDPETFTQQDIDEAIRYLFPSGLYEPRARPMMKPPQEIYPKQKAAQFDMSGRPHHPFFYTARPNFYYLLHEMVGRLAALNKMASSVSTDLAVESIFSGSVWLTKTELEDRLLEKISDQMYIDWVACFDRLAAHPKREKELEFIKTFRKPLAKQTTSDELPPITLEPDGRKSVHIPLAKKGTARADVLVTVPGTGEFKINGKGLDFFNLISNRVAVISPLLLVGWLGKCDVEANIDGAPLSPLQKNAGESIRAVSVRWGIATAIAALGADMEKLRLAGYLTKDRRNRERKKPGQEGARAKWTWKKR